MYFFNILRTTTLSSSKTALFNPITKTQPIFPTLPRPLNSHPISLKTHFDIFPSKPISGSPFDGSSIQHGKHSFCGGIVVMAALALLPSQNKDSLTPRTSMNSCLFPVSVGKRRAISMAPTDKTVDDNVRSIQSKRPRPIEEHDENNDYKRPIKLQKNAAGESVNKQLSSIRDSPPKDDHVNPPSPNDQHMPIDNLQSPAGSIINSPSLDQKLRNLSNNGDLHVGLEMTNGEYVLKLKNAPPPTEIERAEQLAQSGAILLFQAELLRNLGEQLRSQFQASFQFLLNKSENKTE